ncbi:unnamed protein product [Menidia menidia]|uniref:(Atlantic silverside) hypothetical protein n=1 Tax=Menidia menidia TaxID=238744 RepID=A0A8S4A954_9TELE|nr:unnamed protein product [Menidia menidia]
MANSDTLAEEERDFQKLLAQIGGRERIHLVSDACKSVEVDGDDVGILQEFIRDMFHNSRPATATGQPRPSPGGDAAEKTENSNERPLTADPLTADERTEERSARGARRTVKQRFNIHSSKRAIDSSVVVFVFRQRFVGQIANGVCLKEILRDVRARTGRSATSRPALVGLVRASEEEEGAETRRCERVLESLMRSVFRKHAPDTIWVGCFVPKTEATMLSIKKNACRVFLASQTADTTGDRGDPPFWPFQCWFRPQRRTARGQNNNKSSNSRQKGAAESVEEGIPLNTGVSSAEPHVNG